MHGLGGSKGIEMGGEDRFISRRIYPELPTEDHDMVINLNAEIPALT